MKRALAYLRKGQIFLRPISKTTKGLLVAWDPLVISSEEDPELGKKILCILSESPSRFPILKRLAFARALWQTRPVSARMRHSLIWRSVSQLSKIAMR
jgi:hypothetical protein